MYNHYIPQSDGSYRRSAVPEQRRPSPPKPKPEPPKQEPPCPPAEPPRPAHCPPQSQGVLEFLKGLLPREIDTADLMIVFLLLLMNKEDEGGLSPVLTLALYFLL
ncbi:MAG: hypothetical protein E7451_03405 [Ruminococcaceae bacterium]|nr:hypothetical protein [Oscillospiraceae bacterium]